MNSNTRLLVLAQIAGFTVFLLCKLVSSPLILLLLLPVLLSVTALGSFVLHVVFGYLLDARRRWNKNLAAQAARPLAFSTPAAWQAVLTRSQWAYKPPSTLPPIVPDSPVISNAVNEILIMIVRDFILTWYTSISSSPSFPTAVSATLHASLERILTQLVPLDLPAIIVKRVLPKITAHVEHFRDSEVALRGAGLERRLTESEELDMLLAARYAGKGRLHPAVENLSSAFTKQSEEAHLKQLVDRALPYVLPPGEKDSVAVRIVVREIVACVVMYPLVAMFSDPDFWNQKLDSLASEAIRQQRLISKVRNILETQLPSRPEAAVAAAAATQTPAAPPLPETITVRTDARHFESFLRSISRTSSLLDARRLKNDIVGEIRRTRILLANHENDDWINGEKTEDVVAFLDRLYTAKRRAEERIIVLGGHENTDSRTTLADPASSLNITLREVLANPNSLSYFMEFLDRRDRSLLVQFWLTVESFKDPLESADSDSDSPQSALMPPPRAQESSTSKEDITMIYELYFAAERPHPALSAVSAKYSTAIRNFATTSPDGSAPNPAVLSKARRSVIRAQRQVEQAMEGDFEEFERSELWFRVVEDITTARGPTAPTPAAVHHPAPVRGDTAPPMLIHALSPPLPRASSSPNFFLSLNTARNRSTPSIKSTSSVVVAESPSRPEPQHFKSSLDLLMSPVMGGGDPDVAKSRAPLFEDPNNANGEDESHEKISTVAAIQAALTDIITQDTAAQQSFEREREREQVRKPLPRSSAGSSSSRAGGLFDDYRESTQMRRTLSEDSTMALDLNDADPENDSQEPEALRTEDVAESRVGDLQLAAEVARLADKLAALRAQDAMLDTLIKQADLSGDAAELKLLRTSKGALEREMRALAFQREQYAQQDAANALVPERTRLQIVNVVQGEEGGRAVVRYLVEVQQLAQDGSVATGWVVARRYNEFLNMHNKLRERFSGVRTLDFPRKHLVTSLSASFVDTRRTGLEKYIQNLVLVPSLCESEELRAFLSRNSPFIAPLSSSGTPAPTKSAVPGVGLVRSMYTSVAGSIDDMFFGPSMLDVMIQRLTRQAAGLDAGSGGGMANLDLPSANAFTAPISDLILAVFELNKKNNWLRRQAVVVILQQVLGSTVERKLRETVTTLLDEQHLLSVITMFKDGLWPGGKLKPPSPLRTPEEKQRTRDDANRKLSALMPDLAANMIGRSNARRGARRIFAVLQNRRLNQHIVYTVLDEIFASIFPEIPPQATTSAL